MTVSIAPQVHEVAVLELRAVSVDLSGKLADTSPVETLSGSLTVTEVGTSDLTLAGEAISSTVLTINGSAVPIGQAVTFTVAPAGATPGKVYTIKITAATSNSQTVHGHVKVKVL